MTREQEYLAHDMRDADIEYCEAEAKKLEPWTEKDRRNHNCDDALTFVMRIVAKDIERWRGKYCAEMGE